jgi:hypothetical protein
VPQEKENDRGRCSRNVIFYETCADGLDASKFINQSQARITQHLRGSIDASEAPLFYSATDNFTDEDDHNRERDALKASRRNFGAFFGLGLHEEADSEDQEDDSFLSEDERRQRDVAGLAASWKPSATFRSRVGLMNEPIQESLEESQLSQSQDSDATTRPVRSDLLELDASTTQTEDDGHYYYNPEESQLSTDQPPDDLHIEIPLDEEEDPDTDVSRKEPVLRQDPPAPIFVSKYPEQSFHSYPPRQPLPDNALPRPVSAPPLTAVPHDSTWAAFYGLAMAGMFATAFMVWLGTEAPSTGVPLGDTIYSTLHSAFPLLISDAILAVGIAMLWIILMRHALQPFIYLLLFTIPVSMFALFLAPLIQSFRGRWEGDTIQDKAMRWTSIIPALIGIWWTYKTWKERQSLSRAIKIIALSGKIVKENQALVGFSFSVLGAFIAFTFIWVLMFSRVFLRNYNVVEGGMSWVVPTSSWWLGAYYIFMYLWTWGVFSGIQRYHETDLVLTSGLRLLPQSRSGISIDIPFLLIHLRKQLFSLPFLTPSPSSSEQCVFHPSYLSSVACRSSPFPDA